MLYGVALVVESLSEEHILVAVAFEILVERTFKDYVASNEEVCCAELPMFVFLSFCASMFSRCLFLVDITEVIAQFHYVAEDTYSTDDDVVGTLNVLFYEGVMLHTDVRIHIQQPFVFCFVCQQVTHSCSANVLLARYVAYVLKECYLGIFLQCCLVC